MTNQSTSAAFNALGDPTRRALLERIAEAPRPVGALAHGLPVSRPAVSQHLKVLREAGLVREVSEGARRIYHLDPRGVGAMRQWLESFWRRALDDFQAFADADFDADRSNAGTAERSPPDKSPPDKPEEEQD